MCLPSVLYQAICFLRQRDNQICQSGFQGLVLFLKHRAPLFRPTFEGSKQATQCMCHELIRVAWLSDEGKNGQGNNPCGYVRYDYSVSSRTRERVKTR